MDKMQKDFEVWVNKMRGDSLAFLPKSVEWFAYEAWQASRQALLVELPRARSDVDYGYEPSEIIDLLELAGIKCT